MTALAAPERALPAGGLDNFCDFGMARKYSSTSPASVVSSLAPRANRSAASRLASSWQVASEEPRSSSVDSASSDAPTGASDLPRAAAAQAEGSAEPEAICPAPRRAAVQPCQPPAAPSDSSVPDTGDAPAVGGAPASPSAASAASCEAAAAAVQLTAAPSTAAPAARSFRTSQEILLRPATLFTGYPVRRRERSWAPLR